MYVGGHPYKKFKYVPPELANNPQKYKFNKFGYRADEFDAIDESFGVLTVGCSHSFGWGVEEHQKYSSVFCQQLSEPNVKDWNMALPSKSNDYLARTLLAAVPILKPKIVLVCFTGIFRREYYDIEGKCLDYLLGRHIKDNDKLVCRERHSSWLEEDHQIYDHMTELASSPESNMNFYKNYKLIEMLMKLHKIKWAFSTINEKQWSRKTREGIDNSRYVKPWKKLDIISPEDDHMGAKSHSSLADKFHRKITKSTYIPT
jgi:hypothetical protein